MQCFGALGAGTDGAQMFVAIDAGGVAIREADLYGVVSDNGGGLRARLGFEHGKRRKGVGGWRCGGEGFFFTTLVVARGARTLFAQIGEVVVAGVAIGPGDVDSCAGFDVDLYGGRLPSWIKWNRHARGQSHLFGFPLQQSPGGMGLPCGQVLGWPRKVQMR